jgi:acyl carrier protein phosphodiesterase
MNYLAHLYLADCREDSLIGHFLGDFIKGRLQDRYDETLRRAIVFHRRIDTFSDSHPVVSACRRRFQPPWRRFAGVIVDVCYDHFLACHWERYNREPLSIFTQRIYAQLRQGKDLLNGASEHVLERMITHDWLGSYLHLDNVGLALDRIAGRLTRGALFLGSLAEIKTNYRELQNDFHSFFPQLLNYAHQYRHLK